MKPETFFASPAAYHLLSTTYQLAWPGARSYTTVMANASKPHRSDSAAIPAEWLAEFEAAGKRPLATRIRYAFIKTYKPVLDDASFRAFDTMEQYRRWCEENLPDWLGYGRV